MTESKLLGGRTERGGNLAAWQVKAIDQQLPGGLDPWALCFPEPVVVPIQIDLPLVYGSD